MDVREDTLFYEDFQVGDVYFSPSRTVTEADIVNFAGLSGDYNALHTDEEYARDSIFGQRIAHGMLGMVIASGLFTRTDLNGRMSPTLLALLGIDSWKFISPIKINDTIRLEIEIADKRETSQGGKGIVFFKRKVINQNGDLLQEGTTPMLIEAYQR
ncbi:acyl dehydratase [Sporosarcina sp. P21c]|nr:acyl dehydratase [Sporosarcina sp. P16a]PIC83099.1 acyl dehydratase [Sporosarcina sp. P1]PIC90919.1 acyl dehydratase [Sporosarcina sp. P21c]PIC94311.1 acyl dehydratase [Sporosarcina sp. P25]PID23634.1 acyl dehydratase [Sporosarcina sp. P7]